MNLPQPNSASFTYQTCDGIGAIHYGFPYIQLKSRFLAPGCLVFVSQSEGTSSGRLLERARVVSDPGTGKQKYYLNVIILIL